VGVCGSKIEDREWKIENGKNAWFCLFSILDPQSSIRTRRGNTFNPAEEARLPPAPLWGADAVPPGRSGSQSVLVG
jgi:hypothetical protein